MTPQHARELLNQYADCSEAVRSELLNESWKGENMNPYYEDEDYPHDPDPDDDYIEGENLVHLFPPRPQTQTYHSALMALVQGIHHHVLLLKDGYAFNAAHRLADVQPFEFDSEGYPQGGVAVSFEAVDDNRLELNEVKFAEGMVGVFGGAVVYNEVGLIAHLPISGVLQGEELTIRGNG
jgi:hypothetical protein